MQPLNGKIAVITGAASGIGAAAADAFASAGAQLILVDRDEEGCTKAAQRIGARAEICDLTDPQASVRVAGHVAAIYGRVDVLWNNAGIGWRGRFETCTDAELSDVIAVNLLSHWRLTREFLPLLKNGAQQSPDSGASILFTASALALRPRAFCAPYVATKSAIVGLARALAAELGPDGIRVNAICPGLVDTPASRAFTSGWNGRDSETVFKAYRAESPLGRLADPLDVAELGVFLASRSGRSISSASVAVDCGTVGL